MFNDHINEINGMAMKGDNLLRKLQCFYNYCKCIYKSFIRPHLDYEVLCMINLQMQFSPVKFSQFNIMQHNQLQLLLEARLVKNSTRN